MNKLLNRANNRISFGSAATLLAAATLTGTILGIFRTKLINANFNNFQTDAFFAAFKIPDFAYFTLASGALGVAFLPFLTEKLQKNKQSAWEVSSYLLNFLGLLTLFVSILLMIFAEPILKYVVVPGFTPEQLDLSVSIMRIVSINVFVFSISTILTTIQQGVGRFFFFAIAPLFYNLAIIASIYIFGDSLGVVGLSIGVAAGAVLQLLVASMGMIGVKFKYTPFINFKNKSFREVLSVMPARSLDQGVDYVNAVVETRFASKLVVGSVTWYENALILHNAPIMLVGNSIATAAFPRLTQRLAQGRVDLFRKDYIRVLQTMIWIALPVIIVAFFSRGYLARIIFARSSKEIALVFGFLCIAIFFRILYTIISRYFYAYKDTKTPLYVSLLVIALNIVLAFYLSKIYGIVGLALAQGIVAFTEVLILSLIMIKRDPKLFNRSFVNFSLRALSAAGITSLVTYIVMQFLPLQLADTGFMLLVKLGIISIIAFTSYLLVSMLFKLEQSKIIIDRLKKIILRPVKI